MASVVRKKHLPMEKGVTQFPKRNPLELGPVISCVLQYLRVYHVKKCRLISKEWSSSGLMVLKKRSTVVFDRNIHEEYEDKDPLKFFEIFPETTEFTPFTAFKIGSWSPAWSFGQLETIFRIIQKTVRELDIDFLNLGCGDANNRPTALDVSPWIVDSPMTKRNTKYHTKLLIRCSDYCDNDKISVKVSALVNTKEIDLSSCTVHLEDGIKLNPKELLLSRVVFYDKDGKKRSHVPITDVIDFADLKKMCIKYTPLELNGNDELTLDYLSLWRVEVTNWNTCRWTVNRLSLWDMDIFERSEMQVKELYFHYSKLSPFQLNVSLLPISIEKLSLDLPKSCRLSASVSLFFPNLKSLHLKMKYDLRICSAFRESPLVELHLERIRDEDNYPYKGQGELQQIDFDVIPQTVKRLKLNNVYLQAGKSDRHFEKMVLCNNYGPVFNFLEDNCCLSDLKADALVLHCCYGDGEDEDDFLHFLDRQERCVNNGKRRKKCIQNVKRFYAGPFRKNYWDNDGFPEWQLIYYVFEDKKLNVISEAEFLKLSKVGPTN